MLPEITGERFANIARILNQKDVRLGFFFDHCLQF
jgi:hypothetical protein